MSLSIGTLGIMNELKRRCVASLSARVASGVAYEHGVFDINRTLLHYIAHWY